MARFSNWKKLVRSFAILRACIKQKQANPKEKMWKFPNVTVEDTKETEEFVIKLVQESFYPVMTKERSPKNLNSVSDNDGMLWTGGRFRDATSWSYQQRHSVIIPKESHITKLITRHYHDKVAHLGLRSTLGAIREAGFWLINGTTTVKSILNNCTTCRLMGNLPEERLERNAPFTNVGMDVFGPYHVKEKNRR